MNGIKIHHLLFVFSCWLVAMLLGSCQQRKEPVVTPWGTTIGEDTIVVQQGKAFTLSEIQAEGELIILTLNGPDNYYDYHGKGMGTDYLLSEKFAQTIGVSLRVEVCKDTAELVKKLQRGEGDLIAFPLPKEKWKGRTGLLFCGVTVDSLHTQWAVRSDNKELADTLNHWFQPRFLSQVRQEEQFLLSARSITRHVYSPMLNRASGVISHYDAYFQQYAPIARADWRLLAAQCYQESCFDYQAHSWAGACGLMQIMPGTATHLGLPLSQIYEPEANIAAAAKYWQELGKHFADVTDINQRCFYILASYNGGYFHIRDAMRLAEKYGRNPYRWVEVEEFVLKLGQPQYYRDAVVKYGYMRGSETVNYVDRIRSRWAQYRGVASGHGFGSGWEMQPRRAKRKYRFRV